MILQQEKVTNNTCVHAVLQGSMNYQYEKKKKNPMASKQPGIVPIVTMYIGVSEIADDD